MDNNYGKIHTELTIPRHKRRANAITREDVLRDYVVPIGTALMEHDEVRFAYYILEAAAWIEQWEKKEQN